MVLSSSAAVEEDSSSKSSETLILTTFAGRSSVSSTRASKMNSPSFFPEVQTVMVRRWSQSMTL